MLDLWKYFLMCRLVYSTGPEYDLTLQTGMIFLLFLAKRLVEKIKMLTAVLLLIVWIAIFLFLKTDQEETYSLYLLGGSVITLVLVSFVSLRNKKRYRRNN